LKLSSFTTKLEVISAAAYLSRAFYGSAHPLGRNNKRNNFMKYYIFYFIVLSFLISACSSVPIKPLPETQRIPITIQPLNDLTSQYKLFQPSFDSLISVIFAPGIVEVFDPGNGQECRVFLYQNPIRILRPDDKITAQYQLSGDVELISYGSLKDIEDRIAIYSLFGLLGLSLSDNNDMAVCVQYRICLRDSKGDVVDNILVVGSSSGNPEEKSRIQLTSEANAVAACNFRGQLLKSLSKHGYDYQTKKISWISNKSAYNKCIEIVNNLLRQLTILKR
jgi:hypothetical protein